MRQRIARRRLVSAGLALVLVTACGAGGEAEVAGLGSVGTSASSDGYVTVQRGTTEPPGRFIDSRGLLGSGPSLELAHKPSNLLTGWMTPAALVSPDGRQLLYNSARSVRTVDEKRSWSEQGIEDGAVLAVPTVRRRDLASGTDTAQVDGGTSFAWSSGGRLATFRGTDPAYRAGRQYAGHIWVQDGVAGTPEQWSTEAVPYLVAAWAGATLLAYRVHEGEAMTLLALDGPGEVRALAEESFLVALTADGTAAFVADQMGGRLRLVDVASGAERALVDLAEAGVPSDMRPLSYAGDAHGDLVVAEAGPGALVFRLDGNRLVVERTWRFDPSVFPHGVAEPRFTDDAGSFVAWAWDGGYEGSVLLGCRASDGACDAGPRHTGTVRPVYNPSRPEA
jgi:hypothetical protein